MKLNEFLTGFCVRLFNEFLPLLRRTAFLVIALGFTPLPGQAISQVVGGGFTNAGLSGQYYSDPSFTTPAFTRNDVRLDFGTSNITPPGGSSSPGFSSTTMHPTNWSATWTGTFIPRFSEVYTFKYFTSGTLNVTINGSAFINQTSATSSPVSQAYSTTFVANQAYTIQVKYSTGTGPWGMFLHWSSASTPEEAIEPLSMAMGEPGTYNYVIYADQFMSGRNVWAVPGTGGNYSSTLQGQDTNGWPTGDAVNVVWEGQAHKQGAYELQFTGKADVTALSNAGTFTVGTTVCGTTLSSTVGYDSASGEGYYAPTNTTKAKFTVATDQSILYLAFQNTKRLPTDTSPTGITNVSLMKPVLTGSTTSYPANTLFTSTFKNAAANFTVLRWLTANFNSEADWNTTISLTSTVPFTTSPNYFKALVNESECWAREIELSNETGKDLYITMPTSATTAYLANVINLIHYGADSTYTPYTSAQSNPTFPPLNPNLAVYVEWSNEVPWNYAFTNASFLGTMANADATANNAEWQIINYDGASTGAISNGVLNNGYTMECRLQALRVQQASDAFRASFGDAAMGTHVRIVLEDQYGTPYGMPQFLDHYFNKTDPRSTYTGTAHPVNYYIWGGGGATYYNGNNPQGTQTATVVANSSFETDSLSAGTTQSTISNWSVSGTAGLYRPATRTSVLSAAPSLGTSGNTTTTYSYGYKFTVGSQNIGVYQLGRWKTSGNTATHSVRLFDSSANQLASVSINTTTGTTGTFEYANVSPPLQLTAGATYYLVSDETNNGDAFYGNTTGLTTTSAISINAPATANYIKGSPWTFATGTAGSNGYGPVDMQYTTNLASLGFPPDPPDDNNAAYITGTGTISQTINFATSGTYAITFYGAWGKPTYDSTNAADKLRYFIDGVEVTPNSISDFYTQYGAPYVAGGFGINPQSYGFGTTIATAVTAGNHTIKISGTGTSSTFAFIDEIGIGSVDSIFGGGVPQDSYAAMLNTEANWPKAFGIHRVAYEGGWALSGSPTTGGGDGNSLLSDWARWSDSRGATVTGTILNYYAQSGGDVDGFGTYETWPLWDTDNANNYPVMQGIMTNNNQLRAEPTNGTLVPAVLQPIFISYGDQNSSGTISATDGFVSWNIIVPNSGTYSFNLNSTGSSTMIVDGSNTVAQNGTLFLTKGIHSAKVQSTSGSVAVTNLTVAQPSAPGSPTITSVSSGSSSGTITWSAVTGATGYLVSWGTSSGSYSKQAPVTTGTSYNITGLANNTAYYVIVAAYDSSNRISLPSAESSFISLTDGLTGTLGSWSFAGTTGVEGTLPVTSSTTRLAFSSLSRGAGFTAGNGSLSANRFGVAAIGNTYPTTMSGAMSANDYVQFSVTANAGTQFTLNTLSFKPYFQNYNSSCMAGVTYSTDGTTFPPATVSGSGNETNYTVNLNGTSTLQNVSGSTTVTFRIYLYGLNSYSTAALDNLSLTGTLNTLTAPTITTQPANAMVSVGGSQTFSVAATGNPAITGYQWTKNGTNISGATLSSYTISSVQTTDAATYAVKVTNAVGTSTSSNAVLDVLPADAQTAGNLSSTSAALGGLNIGPYSAGSSSVRASGNWWIDGSGGGGINYASDNFHFEQKSLSGDFQMYVNLAALYDYGAGTSRAGIMIRDGTGTGSNFVALAGTASSSGGFKLISRTAINTNSTETTTSGTGMTYTYPTAWMMLERTGTAIHAFVSSDNVNYYEVTPAAGISWTGMSSSLNVGVFSTSGQTGSDALAIMNGFEIIQAATTNGPLLSWDFSTDPDSGGTVDGGEATALSNVTAVAMQSSTITRGSDSPAAQLWVSGDWSRGSFNTRSNDWYQSSLANAKTKGSYYQFTVAPMSGATMSLSSLQLYTYMESASSTATMVVEYSTDGFATEDGVSVGTISSISTGDTGSSTTLNVSTVSALQNFTGTITFRIWGYGFNAYDDKGLGNNPSSGPDVIINGVVQ